MSSGVPIVPASAMATPRPAPATPGQPHGLGGLLGGLEVLVGGLHLRDHGGRRSALVAAEPAERHLDALHVLAGGDEPVGGAPQRVLIEQAQLADEEVGRRRQLRDGEDLQPVVERLAGALGVDRRVDRAR